MNDKFQEKLIEHIDKIAQQLGVASEYIWGTLVMQKFVEGIVYSSIFLTTFLTFIILFRWALKRVSTYEVEDSSEINPYTAITIITGITVIVCLVVGIPIMSDQIMKIFNPEYYAFKELLDSFK